MIILAGISPLEIGILIAGGIAIILYITISIYKIKHPKKKKVDNEDDDTN